MFYWENQWFQPKSSPDLQITQTDQIDYESEKRVDQEKEKEREMQDRLDDFMKLQRAADEDEWTAQDKKDAREKFDNQEAERTHGEMPVTIRMLNNEISYLDSSGRLVPVGGADGLVLKMVGGVPTFAVGGDLPEATTIGTLAVYEPTSGWSTLAPADEDDQFLMSDSSASLGVSWQDDVWR